MNKQYTQVVKAFESTYGAYGKATAALRALVGHTEGSTIKDATAQEKNWQAFLASDEYKAGSVTSREMMRKAMQRIRANCGYSADKKGVIHAKKAVVRGTKERAVESAPAAKELAVHSIASPSEAAKVVSAISTWRAAIDAVIKAFENELPDEVTELLLTASFFKSAPKTKVKA